MIVVPAYSVETNCYLFHTSLVFFFFRVECILQ